MSENLTAKASIAINAPRHAVWQALVNPDAIKKYMFGAQVNSDWQQDGPISWKGEWQGKSYEDKGTILQIRPEQRLQYSHFSPLSGLPDKPENYHTVTIELTGDRTRTEVLLAQDHNATEAARLHSEQNWKVMLEGLKKFVESQP
jgi:uncharacterized protein YndB with AHSA1/START domain